MNLEEKWKNLNGFFQWTIVISFFLLMGGIFLNIVIMILFEDTTGQYLVGQRFFVFQNFWTEWEDVPQLTRDYRAPRDILYLGFVLTLFVIIIQLFFSYMEHRDEVKILNNDKKNTMFGVKKITVMRKNK